MLESFKIEQRFHKKILEIQKELISSSNKKSALSKTNLIKPKDCYLIELRKINRNIDQFK